MSFRFLARQGKPAVPPDIFRMPQRRPDRWALPDSFGLPTGRQLLEAVLWTAALTGLTMLLQQLAFIAVEHHFPRGHISFPFALSPFAQPGDLSNLIGWGYITNNSNPVPSLWDLAIWIALSLGLYRLFKGGAIIGLAGGLANLYELVTRGAVLDWIIVPKGGSVIDGISLGDLLIFIGWAWMLVIFAGLLVTFGKILRHSWREQRPQADTRGGRPPEA